MVHLKKWNAFWYSILTCFRFMCSITRYIKNRCGTTVLDNKKNFKLNNCGSDPKYFSIISPCKGGIHMNKPYTEKERSSVVNRYLNGEKISDISQKTNISRGTIYAWIKQRQESFGEKEIPNYRDLHFLSQNIYAWSKCFQIRKGFYSLCSAANRRNASKIFRRRNAYLYLIIFSRHKITSICNTFLCILLNSIFHNHQSYPLCS